MIRVKAEAQKNLLHFICDGPLTHADYKNVIIPTTEAAIKKHKHLRMFCDMRNVTEIEGRAIWDDFKLGIEHFTAFERFAIISDIWWMGPLVTISRPFFKTELGHFENKDYEEGWNWVNK
jgi:hypothetical protein